ncbi:LysR substrate-binding domain-containing protein [Pseudomonas sp. CC120222-01a]|uniref:LysR substrate-binding domain-containing protein n=1 Tax=Pseudomonas sp. CC120222-01a TaxID=1378075 RepID=UPI000DA0FC99|nr:LysR substrate-binding domain-containing protein [Pseudomonas sp. CC120222-01a]PVZ41188.1 DNA-binding transcriptional LysR family regulator [Pseudomonas sp. CC120222-01a]
MVPSVSGLPPLHALMYFEAVARLLSFTKAADELCVTQSAVSKQVRNLEQSLGFALFERHHRSVRLTAAGDELIAACQPLIRALRECVSRIRHSHGGNVVTVICTQAVAHYWLFPKVVEFNRLRPDLTIHIISTNEITAEACADHDLGVLYGKGGWSGLNCEKLYDEEVYPICSMDFKSPEIERPEQLLGLKLVQLDPQKWHWMNWEDWFSHFDVKYIPAANVLVYNQVTLTLNASARGLGVALGWDFMTKDMIDGGMIRRLGPFSFKTGRSDYLVYAAAKPLSPAAQSFREYLIGAVNAGCKDGFV